MQSKPDLTHKALDAALRAVRKHKDATGRKVGVRATKMVVRTVDLPALCKVLMKKLQHLTREHSRLLARYGRLEFKYAGLKYAGLKAAKKREKRIPEWLQPRSRARNPKFVSYAEGMAGPEVWRSVFGKGKV